MSKLTNLYKKVSTNEKVVIEDVIDALEEVLEKMVRINTFFEETIVDRWLSIHQGNVCRHCGRLNEPDKTEVHYKSCILPKMFEFMNEYYMEVNDANGTHSL